MSPVSPGSHWMVTAQPLLPNGSWRPGVGVSLGRLSPIIVPPSFCRLPSPSSSALPLFPPSFQKNQTVRFPLRPPVLSSRPCATHSHRLGVVRRGPSPVRRPRLRPNPHAPPRLRPTPRTCWLQTRQNQGKPRKTKPAVPAGADGPPTFPVLCRPSQGTLSKGCWPRKNAKNSKNAAAESRRPTPIAEPSWMQALPPTTRTTRKQDGTKMGVLPETIVSLSGDFAAAFSVAPANFFLSRISRLSRLPDFVWRGQSIVFHNRPTRLPAAWPLDSRVTVRPPSFCRLPSPLLLGPSLLFRSVQKTPTV